MIIVHYLTIDLATGFHYRLLSSYFDCVLQATNPKGNPVYS